MLPYLISPAHIIGQLLLLVNVGQTFVEETVFREDPVKVDGFLALNRKGFFIQDSLKVSCLQVNLGQDKFDPTLASQ